MDDNIKKYITKQILDEWQKKENQQHNKMKNDS